MFQQPHSRLTQLTILTRFPCSECGNIKSRSIFSVNSINYSQSQLFSQDLLYHKFSTSYHKTILIFKERKHSYLQRNCTGMHPNLTSLGITQQGVSEFHPITHLIIIRMRCTCVYIILFIKSRRWKYSINAIRFVYS